MKPRCLYCYQPVENALDFHEKCSATLFGTSTPPKLEYSLDQMDELAKHIVERSVAVPGVQPKLSMSLIKETQENSGSRFTVVGTFLSGIIQI